MVTYKCKDLQADSRRAEQWGPVNLESSSSHIADYLTLSNESTRGF